MRNNLLIIVIIFLSFNVNCQNFITVTRSSEGQIINLTNDKVLEIELPCKPSSGYAWHLVAVNNNNVITQIGDWDFIPSRSNIIAGQSGTQVIRFIGVSEGTTELNLEYKRPWETTVPPVDKFKVTVNSNGIYTGNYIPRTKSQEPIAKSESKKIEKSLLPTEFSWESQCTPIKNQGECGSCWAFAATGAFEAIINIIDGNIRSLSEQFLINCDANADGCQGAESCPDNYWATPGAVYESDLPYADGSCNSISDTARCMGGCGIYPYHEKADTNIGINPTVDQIKQAIYNYGPVWVTVCVGNNFVNYTSGINTISDGVYTNHAVVLVGWKDSTKLSTGGYWILRNSWGPGWGEQGYMRIGYNVSVVGSWANYIVYKGGITDCNTGTPTPGSTISSTNPACTYQSFTLSLQNATNRVKYQWQSSPNDTIWSDIHDANTFTYSNIPSQTANTWYRCKVICSGDTSISEAMEENVVHPPITPTAGKNIPSLNQIIWKWNAVPWAAGYKLNILNDYNSATGNGTDTSYTQTGLTANTQYDLYVWAYNSCGNSAVATLKENTTKTGINELGIGNGELKIYPNPVNDNLIIETSIHSLFNINLTNIIGQSVYNCIINEKAVIDMSGLPAGIYLLKIYNENGNIVKKIIKG